MDPTTYIVDRIEAARWAVLEDPDGCTFPVPSAWLPAGVREGDALRVSLRSGDDPAGSVLQLVLDPEERQRRTEAVERLRERLPRGPAGDLDL